MSDNTQLNAAIHPGGDIVRDIDKGGKKVQVVTLDMGGAGAEQLLSGSIPVIANGAFGDITADAWGVPKVSLPHSVLHGLFTFNIPQGQWFMYHGATQVYTSANLTSSNGAARVRADATQPSVRLESRATPRYQPNRGHLFSTALWMPSAETGAVREVGCSTVENGVYFRLTDAGLYAVLRSGNVEVRAELIDTSKVAGFDVSKGNIYDIQYQWRGLGDYKFFINLQLVHVFRNLGTLTALSLEDPALPAMFRSTCVTGAAEIYIGCVDISSENGSDDRLQYASAYAEVTLTGTNQPVLTIYNPLQINGRTNTRMTELSRITLTCDKKATFKVWTTRDPTAVVGATFVSSNQGSFVECDSPDAVAGAVKATSVVTAGLNLVTVLPVQAGVTRGTDNPFQGRIDFLLVRGDYLVITVNVTTGACDAVVEWGEAV